MVEHKIGAAMIEDLYGVLASVEPAEDCRALLADLCTQ